MKKFEADGLVRLDLNNPSFQQELFDMPKPERHSALETLNKLRQMTWNQIYRDNGLKWEKIASIAPQPESLQCTRYGLPGRRLHPLP